MLSLRSTSVNLNPCPLSGLIRVSGQEGENLYSRGSGDVIPSSGCLRENGRENLLFGNARGRGVGERREEENGRQGNGKRAGTSSKIRGSGERNAKSLLDFAGPDEKYLRNSRVVARLGAVFEQKKKKKK